MRYPTPSELGHLRLIYRHGTGYPSIDNMVLRKFHFNRMRKGTFSSLVNYMFPVNELAYALEVRIKTPIHTLRPSENPKPHK